MLRLLRSLRKSPEIIKLGALGSQILREILFTVQSAHHPATYEVRKEMSQIKPELELVLKHVTRGEEKVNAVNYLLKPPRQLMSIGMRRTLMR